MSIALIDWNIINYWPSSWPKATGKLRRVHGQHSMWAFQPFVQLKGNIQQIKGLYAHPHLPPQLGRTNHGPRLLPTQHTPQRRMPHLRGMRIRIGGRFKIWSTWLQWCNEKHAIPLLVPVISLANTLHLNVTPSNPTRIKPIWLLQLSFSFPSGNCHFILGSYGAMSYCHN